MATLLPAWMTQKCPTTLSALQMDELFHHLYIPLQRFMGRRLRDEQQLADAIEDLLHRVARRPYVPGLDKSPRDWLFLESDYTVLDSMRAFARRQKREGLDQPEKVDAGATVPSPSEKMARSDLIQKALATLSPKLQRIFLLRDGEEMTAREVAEAEGIPLGTVDSLLSVARRRLAAALRQMEEIGEPDPEKSA